MHRCRECSVMLQEGRNWHASYAALTYRHCMDCAKAYSKRRYQRLKPGATSRERVTSKRAEIARQRRERNPD